MQTALPHEGGHETGSLASNSPVTDGEIVYAFFGSRGLHALSKDGEPVWNHDFEEMFSKHGHGEGSSPVLHGGTLVVNWDHEGDSFIIAFNKKTGEELWKRDRDEKFVLKLSESIDGKKLWTVRIHWADEKFVKHAYIRHYPGRFGPVANLPG